MENILAAGRRRRFINGVVLAGLALIAAALLVVLGAGAGWFAIVFVLAALATLMLLQAREST